MVVVHVDLSSPELDSTAVLQLIKEHGHKRPAANILFKVSQRYDEQDFKTQYL